MPIIDNYVHARSLGPRHWIGVPVKRKLVGPWVRDLKLAYTEGGGREPYLAANSKCGEFEALEERAKATWGLVWPVLADIGKLDRRLNR